MQFIGSLFALMLFAAILAALLTFGFALFIWLMVIAGAITLWMALQRWWIRWNGGEPPVSTTTSTITIIETDYKDISNS